MPTVKPSLIAIKRESERLKAAAAERKRERASEPETKKRKRAITAEEARDRRVANAIMSAVRYAHVTEHDKELIRELSKDRSVNFIAEKMELDLVLTAAIIARVV